MAIEKVRMDRGELLDALADGAIVVTGNTRLSRSLMAEYERRMLRCGHSAWTTPAVKPLGAWLMDTFEDAALGAAAALPRVLTAEQEEQVWASIVRKDDPGLLRIEATAKRVRTAWKALCEWRLQLADRRFGDNENHEAFRRWAFRFQSACARGAFASESDVPRLLLPLVETGRCPVPDRLLLVGFYELVPGLQDLVAALRAAGCDVDWTELRGRQGQARRLRAGDAADETRLAAAWVRRLLLDNPGARVGIVVPDLAARRSSLSHCLGKTLDPASLLPDAAATPRAWNLSLGRPLADYAIVRTALGLLSLMQHPVDTASFGVLLGSHHWALPPEAAERRAELDRRSLLDRHVRSIGDAAMPLAAVRHEADRLNAEGGREPWSCPQLASRLAGLASAARDLPGRAEAGAWAAAFADWLSRAGWPQGRPLDSAEFQAVEAWNRLLSLFSTLGDFAGALNRSEALALLGRLAGESVFQPQAADAPVQVLGLHEANGLDFDHLWVMGMHDGAWPPAPGPDPFLPLAMQREAGMPNCDPERDWAWAVQVTGQLAAAAADPVFSFPGREGSEELACSPLIERFAVLEAKDLPVDPAPGWQDILRASVAPEPAPADDPIPWRGTSVSGGSRVFQHQAACPFRAFAEHRLGARPLDRVRVGLGAMRSGTLMHRVLETLWRDLQTQAALLALGDEELKERVRGKIAEVLDKQRRRSPATLPARYSALEARRLEQRVMEWLDIERRRSPFRVVGFEQKETFETAAVRVRLSLDRVDELEDGARVVLDYKTGKVTPSGWFGDRPDDPQLPLYGVAAGAGPGAIPLAAVAFAQIRADRVCFNGVVRGEGILPGLPAGRKGPLRAAAESWPEVLSEWSATLERLASEFREGTARVDPKNGLRTCREGHCQLAPLCRVRERLPGTGDEPGDGEDAGLEGSGHE